MISVLDAVSNGMAVQSWTTCVLDARDPSRARACVPANDVPFLSMPAGPPRGAKKVCRLLDARWRWGSEPHRGDGLYLVGRWLTYRDGALQTDPQRPTIARRYLYRFAAERGDALDNERTAPILWWQDATTRAERILCTRFVSESESYAFEFDAASGTFTPVGPRPEAGETCNTACIGYLPGERTALVESDALDGRKRVWLHDLEAGRSTRPLARFTYQDATASAPGRIDADALADALTGAHRQTATLVAADGEALITATWLGDHYMAGLATTSTRATLTQRTAFVGVLSATALAALSSDDVRALGTPLAEVVHAGFGHAIQTTTVVQAGVTGVATAEQLLTGAEQITRTHDAAGNVSAPATDTVGLTWPTSGGTTNRTFTRGPPARPWCGRGPARSPPTGSSGCSRRPPRASCRFPPRGTTA